MITFTEIKTANESIKTTPIKGKEYAEVNQRIKAFRMCYPNGAITTEIVALENGICTIKATVCSGDGDVLATGYAQEKEKSSFINQTSYIENCETSAVGRALGFCGFGIDTSICSAEELLNALKNQEQATQPLDEKLLAEAERLSIDLNNLATYLKKPVENITNDELQQAIATKTRVKGGTK